MTFKKFINILFGAEIRDFKMLVDFFTQGYHALVGDSCHLSSHTIENSRLEADFKHQGKVVGKEVVDRQDVITRVKEQAQKKKEELEKKEDNSVVKAMIQRCDDMIAECERREKDGARKWIGSNDFRDLLAAEGSLDQLHGESTDKQLENGIQIFTELMKKNIPAAVNFRNHQVQAPGFHVNMVRLGGMTDMSNSYVDYGKLKKYAANSELCGAEYDRLLRLRNMERDTNGVTRKAIVLGYACKQLESDESVKIALAGRRLQLQQQFLQLVRQHVANTAEEKKSGPEKLGSYLPMVQLSLLNQNTAGDDKTGWHKSEAGIMNDMAAIFEEMKDSKIVFDGTGPYIDEDNVIHLEEWKVEGKAKEVQLLPVFFNIGVQGDTTNDGDQKVINTASVARLSDIAQDMRIRVFLKVMKSAISNGIYGEKTGDASTVLDFLNGFEGRTLIEFVNYINEYINGNAENRKLIENMIPTLGKYLIDKQKPLSENEELFNRLNKFCKEMEEISKGLEGEKTSYDLACRLQDAVLKSRFFRYSVNCMSGKDRTGIMCAHGALKHVMNQNIENASAIWEKYRLRMFDFGRPALEVARECGAAALKMIEVLSLKSPAFFLPDYAESKSDLMGVAGRIYEFFMIALMKVQPVARVYGAVRASPPPTTPPAA